ncbi:hypothetical protein [Ralstonia phage RSP15]|uniref:hypothetical protein n=1 Tax=Ralstonia phage RSP15 TaxID=1785960 RepID=UPI00074D307A|nr:hypothetical protein BH754_gp148 [Ralstonia phage RSP15]BAU40158.1 hypothetical protein [Ralstonia phage RSP15]
MSEMIIKGKPVDSVNEDGKGVIFAKHPITDEYLNCTVEVFPDAEDTFVLRFGEGDGWILRNADIERAYQEA